MSKMIEHLSKSQKDTTEIAEKILGFIVTGKKKKGAWVIGLSGELGAGKTTLVKAIAKKLGVKERISSPTFVIMKRYPISFGEYKNFFHLDAYRLEDKTELEKLGWREIVKDSTNLVFIEWPENVKGALPKGATMVHISHAGEKERSFRVV